MEPLNRGRGSPKPPKLTIMKASGHNLMPSCEDDTWKFSTDLDFDLLAGLVGRHPLALDGDHPLAAAVPGGGGPGPAAPRAAAALASGLRGLARIDHRRGGDGRDGSAAFRRARGRAAHAFSFPLK